ncbi:MAG: ABC transporter permease, partial [Elusimicrobiota bacterium]|nr:ABC transporter permease [Elusimicrobiota bacterium]
MSFFKLLNYRNLIIALVLRNIKVRYSQTFIGILWALLQPLSTAVVFTIVFSKLIKVPTENMPYILFSYVAILPWSFFSSALLSAIISIVSNATIVSRIYFPREIFPVVSIISAFVDFAIGSVGFCIMVIFYGISVPSTIVFVVPVFFIQVILTLGLGLFLSAINVFYRDIQHVIPYFLQLLMLASPIAY